MNTTTHHTTHHLSSSNNSNNSNNPNNSNTSNTPKPSFFTPKKMLLGVGTVLFALYLCTFSVKQGQAALVFSMGELTEIRQAAGLHFKQPYPLESVETIELRVQTIAAPIAAKLQTSDQKHLEIDSFIQWRIFNPKAFYLRFHGANMRRDAETFIASLVREGLTSAINQRTFKAVTSEARDAISVDIRTKAYAQLLDIGVEMLDVQLPRINFLPEASDTVLTRMKSSLQNTANQHRAKGLADSEQIRADGEAERERLIAEAYRQAQITKGEGDANASAVYAASFGANPEFYGFQRSLEAYRNSFKTKQDVIVVDSNSDFFKYFRAPSAGVK
jgi:modulator of FtsH protease HflC